MYLAKIIVGADGSLGIALTLLQGAKDPERGARTRDVFTPAPFTSSMGTQILHSFQCEFAGLFLEFPDPG